MTRRLIVALALVLLAVVPVSAHGFLVRAVPDDRAVLERAPARVQYWFSEGLEPAFSKLTVRDANGTVVAEGGSDPTNTTLLSAELQPNLPDGAYIADLRLAFASDGHVIAETRVFFVGTEVPGVTGGSSSQADPGEILWRSATLIGMILSFGTAAVYGRVMLPAWGSAAHPAGGLPPRVMARLTAVMMAGLGLAIAAQVYALLHQSVVFFGVGLDSVLSQSLWSVVRTSTRFGEVWNARMLVLGLCAAMTGAAWLYRQSQPELTRPMWAASLWGLIIALGASSVISHAAGSRTTAWAALVLDWTHLLAVGLWVGGLAALVLVSPAALKPLAPEDARKALLAALRRFSPLAATCLAIVVATGIFSASLWVRPATLLNASYGLTLLVKLAMVAGLVGLGAVHRAALNPDRFARWYLPKFEPTGWRRTLRLEVVFGLAALVGAGWLTASPVPIPPDAVKPVAPLVAVQEAGGYEIAVTLSPGGPGANTIDMQITRDGGAVDGLTAELQSAFPEADTRGAWSQFQPISSGVYSTVTPDIDRPGAWWSVIDITADGAAPIRAAFGWDIREDAAVEATLPLNAAQAGALVLALAAFGYALYPSVRWVIRRLDLSAQAVTVALVAVVGSSLALAAGSVLIAQENDRYYATLNPAPQIVNPTLPNAESLARGAALLDTSCGWVQDSAGWEELVTRLPRTRDEELFTFTRDGFRGLPACSALTDAQRWDLVNALRSALRNERT